MYATILNFISDNLIEDIYYKNEQDESIVIRKRNKTEYIFKNFNHSQQIAFELIMQFIEQAKQKVANLNLTFQDTFDLEDDLDETSSMKSQKMPSKTLLDFNQITKEWQRHRNQAEPLLEEMKKLTPNHQYSPPLILEFEDTNLADIFSTIYTDLPYKPSRHLNLTIPNRNPNYDKTYPAPLIFFLDQIVCDRNASCTSWSPPLPQFVLTGDKNKVPRIPSKHSRTIIFEHVTNLPFFGSIAPRITMVQTLLLLDDKECWICCTNTMKGVVYCDSYQIRGYYKLLEIAPRKWLQIFILFDQFDRNWRGSRVEEEGHAYFKSN